MILTHSICMIHGCWQLHLIWLANHSGLVQSSWWSRTWPGSVWMVTKSMDQAGVSCSLPKTMPAKDTEDNAKATEMANKTPQLKATALLWAADLYTLTVPSEWVDPTSWLFCSSWSTGSLCEWIYVRVQVFKSEACVSSWDSLFSYSWHMISNQFHLQIFLSLLFCTLTEMLQHFTCLPHPSPYFYHCPRNPFPTSLPESFQNTKYITPVPSCMAPLLHA